MKIITRRENEGLVIGEDIFITVLQIRLTYVRLAISCSRSIPSYVEKIVPVDPVEKSYDLQPAELELTASRFS
jgi:carbon storage regulator CsrA